jgi:hypothetical protein
MLIEILAEASYVLRTKGVIQVLTSPNKTHQAGIMHQTKVKQWPREQVI